MESAWAGLLTAVAHHCWGWLTICSAIIDFGPDGKLISGPRGTNPHILHCVILLLQHIQLEAHRLLEYALCTLYNIAIYGLLTLVAGYCRSSLIIAVGRIGS